MYDMIVVPRFDGGLNFTGSPLALQDHEWTWSDGFEPQNGCATQMSKLLSLNLATALSITWPPTTEVPVGMVEVGKSLSATTGNLTGLFLFTRHTSTAVVRAFVFNAQPTSGVEVPITGSWKVDAVNMRQRAVFIGGKQLFCGGSYGTLAQNTCAAYTPGTYPGSILVFSTTEPLRGSIQVAAANHALVFGDFYNQEVIRVSDAGALGTNTDWNPTIANTADSLTVEAGKFRGAAPTTQGIIALYDNLGFLLSPTGSDPPFTIATVGTASGAVGVQQVSECPAGTVFLTHQGFGTLGGGLLPGSEKAVTLISPFSTDPENNLKLIYDSRRNALVSIQTGIFFGVKCEIYFNPFSQAWFRRSLPAVAGYPVDHGYAGSSYVRYTPNHFILWSQGTELYYDDYELGGTDGHLGAFVDTKDFAYPGPSSQDYTDSIQVDWESLFSGASVSVYAYSRDALFPAGFAAHGDTGETDYTAHFVLVGTLTSASTAPLKVRMRGRYIRFRFQVTAGRARIRGFSIRRMRGADAGFVVT